MWDSLQTSRGALANINRVRVAGHTVAVLGNSSIMRLSAIEQRRCDENEASRAAEQIKNLGNFSVEAQWQSRSFPGRINR